ncbi:MAG: hypothetical protein OIF50_00395 [Flavobacteriaceae bacterium]|nr:hypothetical protein [Flavobacteriaceae bacterium]
MSIQQSSWYIKSASWEYWPSWVLYIPVYIQHLWLSIKAGNLFFFLRTNPGIDGFILSDSKFETLKMVPTHFLPKTKYIAPKENPLAAINYLEQEQITYPVILKPDIGFRGLLVQKIENKSALVIAIQKLKVPHLLQEYVPYSEELGVFYYRYPGQKEGVVSSLTLKEFLSVKGNGMHTLKELVSRNPRAILQTESIQKRFPDHWNHVLVKDQVLELESIGNHNRGTKFINGNHLISEALRLRFDHLTAQMDGFYFGRFDIRTRSLDSLEKGIDFKILEINGVGGEPTHIYDPDYSLLKAWATILKYWRITAVIAKKNMQQGSSKPSFKEAYKKWADFRAYKKMAFEK